jgi:Leucine-rich repeat (LRR) protein
VALQLEANNAQRVERVYTVVLTGRGLDQVPQWLDRLPCLKSIDLTFNKINEVVGRLEKTGGTLKELRLGSNALESTKGLGKLRNLVFLGLQ